MEPIEEIIRNATEESQEKVDWTRAWSTKYPVRQAPEMNPNREKITGVVCGIRIENIEDPLMREIRYLDKLVDELARGKAMEKILK